MKNEQQDAGRTVSASASPARNLSEAKKEITEMEKLPPCSEIEESFNEGLASALDVLEKIPSPAVATAPDALKDLEEWLTVDGNMIGASRVPEGEFSFCLTNRRGPVSCKLGSTLVAAILAALEAAK